MPLSGTIITPDGLVSGTRKNKSYVYAKLQKYRINVSLLKLEYIELCYDKV